MRLSTRGRGPQRSRTIRKRATDIPRTRSFPANPTSPSILNFPAEIRIIIYELLFEHGRPMLIHDRELYYDIPATPPDSDWSHSTFWDWTTNKDVRHQQRVEHEKDSGFHHDLRKGMGLISTCRQIYYEASDVLYGHNDITFSCVLPVGYQHPWIKYENWEAYQPTQHAVAWLLKIGQSIRFLQRVNIDVCCVEDNGLDPGVDLLPLLEIKWDQLFCNILFTYTRRHDRDYSGLEEATQVARAAIWNRILRTLGDQDALGIRRHRRSYRHMDSIMIYLDTSIGEKHCVTFNGVNPFSQEQYHRASFSMCKEGGSAWWISRYEDLCSGSDMLQNLLCSGQHQKLGNLLERWAAFPSGDCAIDLDRRTSRGINLAFSLMSHKIKEKIRWSCFPVPGYNRENLFTITACYYPDRASEYDRGDVEWSVLSFLHEDNNFSAPYLRSLSQAALRHGCAKIELRIRDRAVEDVRVNLRHLQRVLVGRNGEFHERIEMVLLHEETTLESVTTNLRVSISLITLRRHWFMYLTRILEDTSSDVDLEIFATHFDSQWNLVARDGELLQHPPTQQEWGSFSEHRLLSDFEAKHNNPHKDAEAFNYWHMLRETILSSEWL